MDIVTFLALGVPLIFISIMVIAHPSPVYSALFLVLTLFLLAIYFLFLNAHMVAALQIIVYAGAIMVLFLFVIMLLNLQTTAGEGMRKGLGRIGVVGGLILVAEFGLLLSRSPSGSNPETNNDLPDDFGTVEALGRELFTTYLLPFELTGILLLVAVVGAVVLAKR